MAQFGQTSPCRPYATTPSRRIPTFHQSYLLRNPESKQPALDDLKQVLAVMGREVLNR